MRKVIGTVFVSLDGVMQAPGGPSEDPTGGFAHGGWMWPVSDDAVGAHIGALFEGDYDLLLGRRTYDIFAAYWPFVGEGPIAEGFNRCAKHVLTHGDQPLDWANSHRLASIDAVAELKRGAGPDLIIQGSSTLYPQLLAAGLIDRLTLLTFPLVLGSGKRLFGEGTPARALRPVSQQTTPSGCVIATYEPDGEVGVGSFAEIDPSPVELARQRKMAEGVW